MEVAEPDPGSGLGARLRRAREQRGLSAEECGERLYLPVSVIEALEAEQFATLGGGVYARGHLRRYAGLLELDAASLEQMMLQRLSGAPDLATIQTHRIGHSTSARRRLGVMPVAIVAALLALGVLVWWSMRHGGDHASPVPEPVPVPVPSTPPAVAPPTGGSPGPATAPDANSASTVPAVATVPAVEAGRPAERGPLVIAAARPPIRPAEQPAAAAATTAAAAARKAEAATSAFSSAAPRRRVTPPKPAEPPVPHETQRDYMNFDF